MWYNKINVIRGIKTLHDYITFIDDDRIFSMYNNILYLGTYFLKF